MRLAYCYACKTLEPMEDFEIDFSDPNQHRNDVLLQNWIDRHQHGLDTDRKPGTPGAHPGGRVFPFDASREHVSEIMKGFHSGKTFDISGMDVLAQDAVMKVKDALAAQHVEVFEFRDQLKEDAQSCFEKHGRPDVAKAGCIDYHAGNKRLGSERVAPQVAKWLCTYCPYESTVTVKKRANRGDYRIRR